MDWATRMLSAAAEPVRSDQLTKVRAFASILMIHLAGRFWISAFKAGYVDSRYLVAAIVLTVLLLAVLAGKCVRPALAAATVVQLVIIATTFPEVSNHRYLETLCVGALACFDLSKSEERSTLLEFLRWSLVIVFFHTGLQKLIYGTYFDGQFLAYEIAVSDRFAMLFQYFLPAEEFERIRSLGGRVPGAGPFAVQSAFFLVISNGVWILEMIVPPFMLWRKTRVAAILIAISFTLGIQCGAREFNFALLFTNIGLLFLPGAINRWFIVPFALVYTYLIFQAAGLLDWLAPMVFN